MNRRIVLLSATAMAVTACTPSPANTASVEQVIAQIQAALPATDILAAGIAIAYPTTARYLPVAEDALKAANAALNTLASTMTAVEAQPIVGQIATALSGALAAIGQMIDALPGGAAKTKYQSLLMEAQAVLALLVAFASGVQTAVKPIAARRAAGHLHVRDVR